MRYRKKPVEIEAVQWDGANLAEIDRLAEGGKDDRILIVTPGQHITIRTLEGDMRADVGDWVIRGVQNELYPCKPEVFEATYEPVEEE